MSCQHLRAACEWVFGKFPEELIVPGGISTEHYMCVKCNKMVKICNPRTERCTNRKQNAIYNGMIKYEYVGEYIKLYE